jgi:hypothetical protein
VRSLRADNVGGAPAGTGSQNADIERHDASLAIFPKPARDTLI